MRTIATAIDIDAPPSVVWEHLTDLRSYPEWNPHVTVAEGDLRAGSTLDIRIDRIGTSPRALTVRVTRVDPGRHLAWVGPVGPIGTRLLFEGRHSFRLDPLDGDRTRFHNSERVSGLLASLFVTDEPARDYEAMNEALKARSEGTGEE